MKRIALKIDVDTCRGTLVGVPALIALLQRHAAAGSFFFALGPDHSGGEARSLSPSRYYDLATRLGGRLLPAPDIGVRGADSMRKAQAAGFEVAVHAWNRVRWETQALTAKNACIEAEMEQACRRFAAVFGEPPQAHAAAGWRMNRHALRLTQRLGFSYASDCRGKAPFIPVIDGELIHCPQLPTTLPTLDELLFPATVSVDQAVDRILDESSGVHGDQVFTLRAELEGMQFSTALERLLVEWKSRGHQLVALRDLLTGCNIASLPRHSVIFAEIPGRFGLRMVQGPAFLPAE
ncbi:MAG: polysaccharide deacetylase family protein [Candidatus Accumulibacter sp.]|nr:polysaccharide deacetylase family protein [Accumulibacter sp.]